MTFEQVTGLLIVFVAGLLQGTFILPMTLTRRWQWEHSWAAFSVLGMLVFNWLLAGWLIPGLLDMYRATPSGDLWVLAAFGGLWGVGAVLFGLGMDRLGMAVGYPVIMGLVLSLGALIPLMMLNPAGLTSTPGIMLLIGTAITIGGIVVVSKATGMKTATADSSQVTGSLATGMTIAIAAGILCGLPNIGMNYAGQLKEAAISQGASEAMAGNAVWVLLFTTGFVLNLGWCLGLMIVRGNLRDFFNHFGWNLLMTAAMGLFWIGSFYLYGIGAARMGKWGGIIGWPVFIALSIIVGNLWGIWRGEWASAPGAARRMLNWGLAVLLVAIAIFGASSALS